VPDEDDWGLVRVLRALPDLIFGADGGFRMILLDHADLEDDWH